MRRLLALLVGVLLLAMPASSAPTINFQVYTSTLNKLAGAVGPISGDAGSYDVDISTPFGNIVVYRAHLYWTLSNANFQISPQGISFTGQLNLAYYKFSYATNVTGSVTASFQQNPTAFVVSISNIVVPVQFNLPVVGNVTLTNLTVNPQYAFSFPISPAAFSQPTPSGSSQMVYGQISSATLSYKSGYVEMDTVPNVW
jgi:hypothetical protein